MSRPWRLGGREAGLDINVGGTDNSDSSGLGTVPFNPYGEESSNGAKGTGSAVQ